MQDEIAVKLRAIKNKFINQRNQFLHDYGITRMEFDILNCIYASIASNKRVQASALAKKFEVSIPAVMHKLDALEQREMVEKSFDSEDRRVKYYTLTPNTLKKYEKLFASQMKKVERYFEALGEEKEHLNAILDITIQFLEENNE